MPSSTPCAAAGARSGRPAPSSIVTGSASQTLTNIGEMLVMDADGKLHVQNEADDILQFRRYTVPKEEKAKKAKDESALGPDGVPTRGRRPTD